MTLNNFHNLLDMLAYRAEHSPTKIAFTFNDQPCSFGDLWRNINRFAVFLFQRGIKRNECVILSLPNSAEFFFAFYGTQLAGCIAVPIFPQSGMGRVFALAGLCDAKTIVLPLDLPAQKILEYRKAASNRDLSLVTVQESYSFPDKFSPPNIQPEDVAFIQYTSGSTGSPKGVMLTHHNLLTNIRQMIAGMEITERDIFVSWLPVYHDMGLILKTMVPFYLGAETHLLPTDLRNVRSWLAMIQSKKATFTAAPDFAYRLVARRVDQGEFDLSSLRVALNAAEPVRPSTIEAFEQTFNLKNVMTAGYGLAEATVGVSMSKPSTPIRLDQQNLVSVGKPFSDVFIKIAEDGKQLQAGEVGEITIRSTANSTGYYNNPYETTKLFLKDGYILTGDLGYLDEDGYLYIIGRKKNTIKHLGRTIAPQEIEELMDAMRGIRFSAAVGIDRGGMEGEQVYVFAELRNQEISPGDLFDLNLTMVEDFHQHMGFRPARIFFLKPHAIPLTHNGKIQYGKLREIYLAGTLRQQGLILFPEY